MRKLIGFLVLGILAVAIPVPASAAGGCATRGEYDNLVWGLSADQVQSRFETNGWYISTGDEFFKRGYNACWDDDRKIVIWYDLNLGLTDHWDVRDQ